MNKIYEDNIWMPKELTAENGAKGLLSGEYFVNVEVPCFECLDTGLDEDCADCDGTALISRKVTISWTTIKEMYADIVKNYGNCTSAKAKELEEGV